MSSTSLQLGVPVARIELLDDVQLDAVNRHFELDYEVAPTLFFEFHGTEDEVAEQAAEVEALAREHGGARVPVDDRRGRAPQLWQARHPPTTPRARCARARALRPTSCVPISRLAECIARDQARHRRAGLPAPIVGHVGDGNFHVRVLLDPDDPAEVERADAFNERLVKRASRSAARARASTASASASPSTSSSSTGPRRSG